MYRNDILVFIRVVSISVLIIYFYSMPLSAQHVVHLNKVSPDFKVRGPGTDEFGSSLTAGDVNGDGKEDLIVGDPAMPGTPDYPGGVRVFYGRKFTSPSTVIELSTELPDLAIVGDTKYGYCGDFHSIACGDINGDEIDDIIMGDHHDFGTVFVIYGRTDFSPNEHIDLALQPADLTIEGKEDLGKAVAVLDFNKDGVEDIVFSAPDLWNPRYGTWPGHVYLIYGSPDFPTNHVIDLNDTKADLEIWGMSDGRDFGNWVAGGDINGDDFGDLLIGTPRAGAPDYYKGHVYVVFGEENLPTGTTIDFTVTEPAVTIVGESFADDDFGRVASGDLNKDGYDEIICSVPFRMEGGHYFGRVYVVKGSGSFPPEYKQYLETDPADITIEATGLLGYSISCGELSGDSYDDLIMGRPTIVEVLFGSKNIGQPNFIDLTNSLPDIRIMDGPNKLGECIGACDLNSDGIKDIAAGTRFGGAFLNYHGAVYVVFAGGAKSYGEGLEGSGGIVPVLSNTAEELPVIGMGQIELTVTDGLEGASGFIFFSLGQGSLPFFGGTFLLDFSTMFLMLPINLTRYGSDEGTGSISIPFFIPDIPELNIMPLFFQAAFHDPEAVKGISLTNGLQISFLSKGE